MKRISVQFAAVAALLGATCLLNLASGDGRTGAKPMKIALIDMDHVLVNYKKSDELTAEMREAYKAVEAQGKALIGEANSLKTELKSGTFDEESSEFEKRENRLFHINSQLKVLEAQTKSNMQKQHVSVVQAVYQDVQQAVERFAAQNGYTLILKINRDTHEGKDSQQIQKTLSQQIVFHQGAEDITDPVLSLLNQEFEAAAGSRPAKAAAPAKKSAGNKAQPEGGKAQTGAPKAKAPRRTPRTDE